MEDVGAVANPVAERADQPAFAWHDSLSRVQSCPHHVVVPYISCALSRLHLLCDPSCEFATRPTHGPSSPLSLELGPVASGIWDGRTSEIYALSIALRR